MSELIIVKCDCGNTLITDDEISKNKCKNCRYKISYKELIIKLDYLEILTTFEEWNLTNRTATEKIKFKCTSIDCNNEVNTIIGRLQFHSKKCVLCCWGTKYEDLILKLDYLKVLTTKEEWDLTNKNSKETIKFKCTTIDCSNELNVILVQIPKHTKKCIPCSRGITYEDLVIKLKYLKILTTKEEWNLTTKSTEQKIKFECINIDCTNEFTTRIIGLSQHSKKCLSCCHQITYEELTIKLENIIILTTKEEWNLTTKMGEELLKFKCMTNDCNNEITSKINTLNLHSKKCVKCNKLSYSELINKFPDVNFLTTKEEWELTAMNYKEIIKFICININCNNETQTKIRELQGHSKQCVDCMKKISYSELKTMITDVKLLTSEKEWKMTQKTKADKIKIECINNKCKNERITTLSTLNNITKLCMECVYKSSSNIMKSLMTDVNGNTCNPFHIYETELFNKLNSLLSKEFILKKTNDGCKCDMYLKPINNHDNSWLQIQFKTSKQITSEPKFTLDYNTYNNMIIMLYSFTDNKYWLIDGNLIPSMVGILMRKGSKYNKYLTKEEEISKSLHEFYKTKILFDENTILGQLCKTHTIEHNHRQKRENLLKKYFVFAYPPIDNMVYDLQINNYKIQDKSGHPNKANIFQFKIKRSHDQGKWYDKSDNDFYWLYNTTNSKFLVIPTYELVKYGIVRDDNILNQELKSSFMFNFEDYENHIFGKYVFDYDNLDINKLQNLINSSPLESNYYQLINKYNTTNEETTKITNNYNKYNNLYKQITPYTN